MDIVFLLGQTQLNKLVIYGHRICILLAEIINVPVRFIYEHMNRFFTEMSNDNLFKGMSTFAVKYRTVLYCG